MCVCTGIYVHVCMWLSVCMCVCSSTGVCVGVHVCVSVCIHVCMHACVSLHVSIHTCTLMLFGNAFIFTVHVYVMCACTYTYTHLCMACTFVLNLCISIPTLSLSSMYLCRRTVMRSLYCDIHVCLFLYYIRSSQKLVCSLNVSLPGYVYEYCTLGKKGEGLHKVCCTQHVSSRSVKDSICTLTMSTHRMYTHTMSTHRMYTHTMSTHCMYTHTMYTRSMSTHSMYVCS